MLGKERKRKERIRKERERDGGDGGDKNEINKRGWSLIGSCSENEGVRESWFLVRVLVGY